VGWLPDNKLWQGKVGNIPETPCIIVTPVNLHLQMEMELQRFLIPQYFDILPYVQGHKTRTKYWDNVWNKSKNTPANRILLATVSVSHPHCLHIMIFHPSLAQAMQSDVSYAYGDGSKKLPCSIQEPKPGNRLKTTVFGQNWLLAAIDEAHVARNLGQGFFALLHLRRKSSFMMAMTATPVNTKLLVCTD
jgi:hypothetical protein